MNASWFQVVRHAPPRRGSLYVSVMGVSLIVAIAALASMHMARVQLRHASDAGERQRARLLALAAVEHAVALFNQDPSWQTTYTTGVEYPSPPVNVGGGTFTWKLNAAGTSFQLDGIGRVGTTTCAVRVDLGTESTGVLSIPLLVGGDLTINSGSNALAVSGGPAGINGAFNNYGTFTGDVEAQSATGSLPSGTLTVPGTLRKIPSFKTVSEYYLLQGTLLSNASLDDGFGGLAINGVVLSPYSNPFGATNAEGIYLVDANGKGLTIKDSRIVGTLVVYNLGISDVSLKKEVNWEPASPTFPALLVDGPVELRLTDTVLSESSSGVNFNPLLTPYQGETDSSLDDTYPSTIAGIVYSAADLIVDGNNAGDASRLTGVVICGGNCLATKVTNSSVAYDGSFASSPPPGFGSGSDSEIVIGSWRQVASP